MRQQLTEEWRVATLKQQRAAKLLLEKGGSVSQAMRDAGYSLGMAKNPQKLTGSKGFKALLDGYLPDEMLFQRHAEALDAVKLQTSPTEPDRVVVDHQIRLKAVELGYKLKGKLTGKAEIEVTNPIPILGGLSVLSRPQARQTIE